MSLAIRNADKLRKVFEWTHAGAVAAGEPTYNWTFTAQTGLVIDRIEASAEAADGTDGFVASLLSGSDTLYSVAVAGTTPVDDNIVATDETDIIPDGTVLTVRADFSGATASENVTSPHIVVYAHIKGGSFA